MSAPIPNPSLIRSRSLAPPVEAAFDMKMRVPANRLVRLGPVRRHPTGPAELRFLAQANRRDFAGWYREIHVPVVLLARVKENCVGDFEREGRTGQELLEMFNLAYVDPDAELVVDPVHAGAGDAIDAETAVLRPEAGLFARLKHQPGADELLNLDAGLEQARQKRPEPRGALDPGRKQSSELQLGEVGDRVGVSERARADADRRADVGEKSALEDIDELDESVISLAEPAPRLLGRGERQRPLRPEHSEEPRLEPDAAACVGVRRFDVRVRESEIRIFAHGDELVGERARVADARLSRILPLQPAQDGEQVELPGLGQ